MADSRVENLVKRVFTSLADLTGVRLWSGKTGESDALGLEVSELLSSDVVADDSIDFKALTPKGFNASTMTEARKGVGEIASDAEITNKTTSNILTSSKQSVMQTQWWKDWHESNGQPNEWGADDVDSPSAISYDSHLNKVMVGGASELIGAPFFSGKRNDSICFMYSVSIESYDSTSGFVTLKYTGSLASVLIYSNGGVQISFTLSADGRWIYVHSSISASVIVSTHINATLVTA